MAPRRRRYPGVNLQDLVFEMPGGESVMSILALSRDEELTHKEVDELMTCYEMFPITTARLGCPYGGLFLLQRRSIPDDHIWDQHRDLVKFTINDDVEGARTYRLRATWNRFVTRRTYRLDSHPGDLVLVHYLSKCTR